MEEQTSILLFDKDTDTPLSTSFSSDIGVPRWNGLRIGTLRNLDKDFAQTVLGHRDHQEVTWHMARHKCTPQPLSLGCSTLSSCLTSPGFPKPALKKVHPPLDDVFL